MLSKPDRKSEGKEPNLHFLYQTSSEVGLDVDL